MRRIFAILLCCSLLAFPVRGAQQEKFVALTFDDGPSGRFTRKLLEGLEQRDAKATFFLCGYRIAQYPELTQRIADEGHEIGLHGYSHKNMGKMTAREVTETAADNSAFSQENFIQSSSLSLQQRRG